MKRLLQIVLIVGALILIASYISSRVGSPSVSIAEPSPTPIPTPTPVPLTLIIPKLKIKAPIDSVGVTESGNMDVPQDASRVGWYKFGPTPSVRGNSVITGHYDTPSGRPAIFYRLSRLAVGDTIEIELNNTTRHTFVVTGKDSIDYDIFPEEYVFATKFGTNLNLITCNGVWDPVTKNYSKRLVIYTTLKGTQFGTF